MTYDQRGPGLFLMKVTTGTSTNDSPGLHVRGRGPTVGTLLGPPSDQHVVRPQHEEMLSAV